MVYRAQTHRRTTSNRHKWIVVAVIIVFLAAGVVFVLEKSGTTSFFSSIVDNEQAQTTSDVPSAQPDYNGGAAAEENKDPGNTIREDKGTAVITDTNGATSSDTSQPLRSSTGEITVYLPHSGSKLASGQELSGTSTLSTVQYRLIDNVSGVITTGSLRVVNSKFSGTLSFDTSASEGRLDIFGTKSDANEFSNIEIPVRFR